MPSAKALIEPCSAMDSSSDGGNASCADGEWLEDHGVLSQEQATGPALRVAPLGWKYATHGARRTDVEASHPPRLIGCAYGVKPRLSGETWRSTATRRARRSALPGNSIALEACSRSTRLLVPAV